MALRLDGYIRVSRVGGREGEGYISPDEQRDSILAYAAQLGGEIVAWHDDQDYSGGNTERPGFQAMLERLERQETDGTVVMAIDRFARSTADGYRVIKAIVNRGQVFASCRERIDPRTPEGRYMLRSFLSNAELFLEQMEARWESAKGRAIARGAHIGPTPNGYLKVDPLPSKPTHISPIDSAAMGGPTGPGLLVPRPVYGAAMSDLFERGAAGRHGDSALAQWMTKQTPREGGAPWSPTEVRRWLSNRIYLGEVRYGPLVNAKAHKPLTDEETWQRCQREPGEQRRAPSPFLLKGLVRCAACRYAMGGHSHGGAGSTAVYRCYRGTRGCPSPAVITAARIEKHLVDMVVDRQQGVLLGQADDDTEALAAIEAYDEAVAEVEAFVADTEARKLLGEAAWQEGLRIRVFRRDELKPARDVAIARLRTQELAQRSTSDLDRHGLRDLLAGMVRHAFVRRAGRGAPVEDRVLVVWADDLRVIDVPGQHNRSVFEPVGW